MAVIYLEHPVHGQKVACGDQEAAYDRANGWVDFDPAARIAEAAQAAPVEVVSPAPAVPSFLAPTESDIPAHFPARQLLIDGGITKWADLVTKTEAELVALKGIGKVMAREILDKIDS